jgi:Zn-dependent peptidase ImmA (M78 family)
MSLRRCVPSAPMTARKTSSGRPLSQSRSAARRVLQELRIRKPADIDVELIAAHYGVFVEYKNLPNEEGHLLRAGSTGIIVVNSRHRGAEKERFIEAHELGHFFRHEGIDQFELCTNQDLGNWYTTSGYETEANVFAAELLMPEALFARGCDRNKPNLHHVRELAAAFRTSLTATAIRFVECSPEPCAVVHSTAGVIDWSFKTEDFAFRPPRGARLTTRTNAGDIFAGKPVADRPETIDGAGWPNGLDMDIQEHSMKLGNYNSVLTLLWHAYQE